MENLKKFDETGRYTRNEDDMGRMEELYGSAQIFEDFFVVADVIWVIDEVLDLRGGKNVCVGYAGLEEE